MAPRQAEAPRLRRIPETFQDLLAVAPEEEVVVVTTFEVTQVVGSGDDQLLVLEFGNTEVLIRSWYHIFLKYFSNKIPDFSC